MKALKYKCKMFQYICHDLFRLYFGIGVCFLFFFGDHTLTLLNHGALHYTFGDVNGKLGVRIVVLQLLDP